MRVVNYILLLAVLCLVQLGCGDEQPFNSTLDSAALFAPVQMLLLPGDRYALVNNSNFSLEQSSGSIVVIDLEQRQIISEATIAVPNLTRGMSINSDATKLYLANSQDDAIMVYDLSFPAANGQPVALKLVELSDPEKERFSGGLEVGEDPFGCIFVDRAEPLKDRVYLSNITSGDLTIFDPSQNVVEDFNLKESDKTGLPLDSVETLDIKQPLLGRGVNRFYADQASGLLLLPSSRRNNIFVIDPKDDGVEAVIEINTISVTGGIRSTVLTADNEIWASHAGMHGVIVLDGSQVVDDGQDYQIQSAKWLDFVATGIGPEDIALNPAGDKLFVANFGENIVSVIDLATRQVTKEIKVGIAPYELTVNSTRNELYVLNFYSDTISIIDLATESVVATIP